MGDIVEQELCANCKKEIPQANYVMHTMHCARNISLCPICKEPFPKNKLEEHKKKHASQPKSPPVAGGRSGATPKMFNGVAPVPVRNASTQLPQAVPAPKMTNGTVPRQPEKPKTADGKGLLACRYCELELPKLDLESHENYCGTRTDKCIECGEFVMFKYKKLHEDSNHGFVKLSDEPGPRASWDSSTQRSNSTSSFSPTETAYSRRSRLPALRPFDMTSLYNMSDYIPPSSGGRYSPGGPKKDKGESYKDLSRRLDCKTEYIKNLLHDSASITAPLRSSGSQPRNHFNHNKGPAPQPPPSRRRNPPTELTIPCEFCSVPIPHEDLIQHETGCRPDLARFTPRSRLAPDEDDYFVAPPPSSPEVELPCEFCADMIPASQLLMHQAKCN